MSHDWHQTQAPAQKAAMETLQYQDEPTQPAIATMETFEVGSMTVQVGSMAKEEIGKCV